MLTGMAKRRSLPLPIYGSEGARLPPSHRGGSPMSPESEVREERRAHATRSAAGRKDGPRFKDADGVAV